MFVELEDFRTYLRKTSADQSEDASLLEALQAAEELVEHHLGGPLDHTARQFDVYPSGACLVLNATRLTEVVTITDPEGGTIPLDDVDVHYLAGIITLPFTPAERRAYKVVAATREHGAALRLAVKITAAHLYATEPRGAAASAGAARHMTTPGAEASAAGFALPRRAAELIATARMVTVR